MTFPGLTFSEELTAQGFALQLYDGFTGLPELQGLVSVNIANQAPPIEKTDTATFVFLNIRPGAYSIVVQPAPQTPFYSPVNFPINLPMPDPLWQAYPDQSLADRSKPLDDPTQPPAYRAQRQLATLVPTPSYPFPSGATLVRGTVSTTTGPLVGATVEQVPGSGTTNNSAVNPSTLTDENGEFALFFNNVSGMGQAVTIQATYPLRPQPVQLQVTLQRGATVSIQIVM
jgi:hypothetical protein